MILHTYSVFTPYIKLLLGTVKPGKQVVSATTKLVEKPPKVRETNGGERRNRREDKECGSHTQHMHVRQRLTRQDQPSSDG